MSPRPIVRAGSAPALERCAGAGYRVAAYYLPTLAAPTRAIVTVSRDGALIDLIELAPAAALETWRHAGALMPRYRAALTGAGAEVEPTPAELIGAPA